jgi:Arc/MetJ family transcription regulator
MKISVNLITTPNDKTCVDMIYKTCNFIYRKEIKMKTLVDINENVLKEAMEVSGTTTKKETITLALEELIRSRLRQRLKSMAGSGMMETSLSDLKSLRQRREKTHKSLRTVAKQ